MSVDGLTAERKQAVHDFGTHRRHKLQRIVRGGADHFDYELMLAIGLRESLLAQKIGAGTDRGVFQLNDTWNATFLKMHRGTRVDHYLPIYKSAYPKGRCPTLRDGCVKALQILHGNYHFGQGAKVQEQDLVRFAVAAYNCGAGGAIEGYNKGNLDMNTANGDYSADVMKMHAELTAWLK